jgi:hypothetical protein
MGSNFEISVNTKDDPSGIQSATAETKNLYEAMGKLLERAAKKEEYQAARGAIAEMTDEEKKAALSAYETAQAQEAAGRAAGAAVAPTEGLSLAMTELNSTFMVIQKVIEFVKKGYDMTVGSEIELAEKTEELQNSIGGTAEEASTLIAVSDDLRVSYEDLQKGIDAAIKKGFSPNTEGLIQLGEEYRSIQDPIAQSKFLMDTFGKSGEDVTRLMRATREELASMASDAKATGQVFSSSDINQVNDMKKAWDDFSDIMNGYGMELGKELIPLVIDFVKEGLIPMAEAMKPIIDWVAKMIKAYEEFSTAYRALIGWKDVDNAANRLYIANAAEAELQAKRNADAEQDLTNKIDNHTQSLQRLGGVMHNPGDANYHPGSYYQNDANPQGRASGGDVQAGRLYQVNENKPWTGPEYFVAPADGVILPSAAAAGLSGGAGATIHVAVNYNPTVSLSDRAALPDILFSAVEDALRRLGVPTNA